MTPAKLRELASATNPPDALAILIGAPLASGEPVTTETVADALAWAAAEIERMTTEIERLKASMMLATNAAVRGHSNPAYAVLEGALGVKQ